ncbi:MAG: vitamin B12 dependent-methionine synthase activation domain-containing protein [Porcipelethomonas sp.]
MTLDSIDRQQALRYSGFKGKNVPEKLLTLVEECEKELLSAINPDYIFRCFDIRTESSGIVIEGSTLTLMGKDIKRHLEGCEKAVLMCATLGIGADRLIKQLSVSDMSRSFMTDALASAAIEQVCDEAEKVIKEKFPDMYMTWRYSPGYGDFPIEQQTDFLAVTNASKRIGLNLTEGGMLMPSKSVTAVIGLSGNPVNQKKRGCACCNMAKTCSYRRRGEHCGF